MISPTPRLLLFVGLALVPALLVPFFSGFGWVALGVLAVVTLAAAVDARRGSDASVIAVRRVAPDRLSLGVDNEIHLDLINQSARPRLVEIKDDVPRDLVPAGHVREVPLPENGSTRITYTVKPPNRGEYVIPAVDIRVRGGWRLMKRARRLPESSTVHVYPNVREVGKYELLLHRRRLHLMGLRAIRRRGKGTDFDNLREYVPDDDFRDINWKATAKAGHLVTQTYRIERSQNVIIGVESGRMMTTRVDELTKLDHAINAALLLAHVAASREDRVGLVTFSSEVHRFLRPRRGRRQVAGILEALHALQPSLVEPDFASAIKTLRVRYKRRSLFVLFTDLLDEQAGKALARHLHLLQPTYLPLVVAVSDPTVARMAEHDPRTSQEAYQAGVAAELLNERREILGTLRQHGALVIDSSPIGLTGRVVNRYLEIKARGLL